MANNSVLKAAIADVVKQNGTNAITGDLLQQSLLSMIDALGGNYQYVGIATPETTPGTPDQNVIYLASTAGTYTNFGGFVLADGEIAILKYNGAWSKDSTGAASLEIVNQLGQIPVFIKGYYISTAGSVISDPGSMYSKPIRVYKGQVVYINTGGTGTGGLCLIAKYDSETYTPLLNGSSGVSYDSCYMVTEDCFISICLPINGTASVSPTDNMMLFDINNIEKVISYNESKLLEVNSIEAGSTVTRELGKTLSGNNVLVLECTNGTSNDSGIVVRLFNGSTLILTTEAIVGDKLRIGSYNSIGSYNKIEINNRNASSIDLFISEAEYVATESVNSFTDNDFLNGIIKELYIPENVYNNIGLSNSVRVQLWNGFESGGIYHIGFYFNDNFFLEGFNSLQEVAAANRTVIGLGSGVMLLADLSQIPLGERYECYCKVSEKVTSKEFSPVIFGKDNSLPLSQRVFNVSLEYPTGGINGTEYYDLARAVSKVTEDIAIPGLMLVFTIPPAQGQNGIYTRQYILSGLSDGPSDIWYHNVNNYKEIFLFSNFYDVSFNNRTGGDFGDERYSPARAISVVPTYLRQLGLQIRFTNFGGYSEVWQRIGDSESYGEITGWKRVDIPLDYLASCENRLANLLYETFEHYNQQHPDSPIVKEVAAGGDGVKRRIPVSEISNSGTVIVACEKRINEVPNTDYGDFGIEISRKPASGSWSSQVIASYSQEKGYCINPSLVVERDNSQGHQGRIYAFFGRYKIMAGWEENTYDSSDFIMMYSDDDGVTWSNEISLKLWDSLILKTSIPAPTKGLQLTNGTLVVPCMGVVTGTNDQYRCQLMYKTVGGDWTFSNIIEYPGSRMNECAIIEAETNRVYLISRNEYSQPPMRDDYYGLPTFYYNFSNDTWVGLNSTFVNYHACELSLQKVTIDGQKIYLMSAIDVPRRDVERLNITIWASLDLDKWMRVYRIQKEPSWGYSALSYYDGQLVVAYESFIDGVSSIRYQDVSAILPIIYNSVSGLNYPNLTVQDRMQQIINMIKGID